MKKPKILILTTKIFFQWGGSEILVDCLKSELETRDCEVDILPVPLIWEERESLVQSAFSARMINLHGMLSNKPDLVIATRFPAYLVKHPKKIIWLFHQHRQVYELCGTEYSDLGFFQEDLELRQIIQRLDTVAFNESKAVFTISTAVAERLKTYNGVEAKVLYPVPPDPEKYYNGPSHNYVLSVGRLERIKRIDLLIEAMQHVSEAITCHIIGTGSQEDYLKKKTRDLKLENRISFLGSVSRNRILEEYAHALAVFYGPYQEDFGFSSIEGLLSKKPVITLQDSGGVNEFISDGVSGFVCVNSPSGIAEKINQLSNNPEDAGRLGENGFQMVSRLNWDYLLDEHILKHL